MPSCADRRERERIERQIDRRRDALSFDIQTPSTRGQGACSARAVALVLFIQETFTFGLPPAAEKS